jgi:asparagine synthase (glutamine-hydrolysing)
MCGIVGGVFPGLDPQTVQRGLDAMCLAMRHRGPDDQGELVEHAQDASPPVGLAMRRLSIIDTGGGHQPIHNEDGALSIVFNGEIYNHRALRQDLLRKGHTYRTQSDTETILHLYEEYGDEAFSKLCGMFTFAILDRRRQRLVLARDRLGIKPLYLVHGHDGGLAFASELKSILAAPALWPAGWSPELDHGSLAAMLLLMYVPSPRTIYKDMGQLAPGHTLTLDLTTGRHATRAYWKLCETTPPDYGRSFEDAQARLDALLSEVVRDHLESDVPVGAFVSGGVDSSLVASYAAQHYQGQLQTFSIGFDEALYDETHDALAVARRLKTPHTVQYATYDALYGALPKILQSMDQPFGDSSMLPTFLVSQMAASRLKVVLSGDGGDEVFAGYTKHTIEHYKARLPLPAPAVHAMRRALRYAPKSRGHKATEFLRRAEKAARAFSSDPAASAVEVMKLADASLVASLLREPVDFEPLEAALAAHYRAPSRATNLQRTQHIDLAVVLPDDMLTKVDRMSMLASLEVRVPLLDHRVVEFGWHLPDEYKLQGRQTKRVLKALYCQRFGLERYSKPKQGFGVPIEAWFHARLAPMIRELFDAKRLGPDALFRADAFQGDRAFDLARAAPFVFWNALMAQTWHTLQRQQDPTPLRLL